MPTSSIFQASLTASVPDSLPACYPTSQCIRFFCLGIPIPARGLTPHPGVTGPCVECCLLAYLCRLWIVVRWPEFRPGRTRHAQIFFILGLRAFFRPAYQPAHLLCYYFRTYSISKPAYQPTHLFFYFFRTYSFQFHLSTNRLDFCHRCIPNTTHNQFFPLANFKHLSGQPNGQRT